MKLLTINDVPAWLHYKVFERYNGLHKKKMIGNKAGSWKWGKNLDTWNKDNAIPDFYKITSRKSAVVADYFDRIEGLVTWVPI